MFNIEHGSAPEYLKNNINITREPAHNTRSGSFACYIFNVKALALNLSFSQVANFGILYLIAYNVTTNKFIFKKMIKGTVWNRLRSAHFSEYIFYDY